MGQAKEKPPEHLNLEDESSGGSSTPPRGRQGTALKDAREAPHDPLCIFEQKPAGALEQGGD